MRVSNRRLKKCLGTGKAVFYTEEKLQETIEKSKAAFAASEAETAASYVEFLYQQSRYIHKRWWILQGMLLLLFWFVLDFTGSGFYTQRGMGVGASMFAILLLPELWKNRNANALEIESASYYSLRQIYSARIFALALVDFLLLCAFALPVVLTGKLPAEEMMVQFFLPYLVTCCICFRILFGNRTGSEAFALFLCVVWCAVWTKIVLTEKVYGMISLPVWSAMTIIAALYLIYCVYKGTDDCTKMWEVNT